MNAQGTPVIAVCVATYNRPIMLLNCIKAIAQIQIPKNYNVITIVVDNDKNEGAREIVKNFNLSEATNVYYFVETNRGIASARNRLLHEANRHDAKYISFIDDDEFPHAKWLVSLLKTLQQHNADIVSGPVISTYDTSPSENIKTDIKYVSGHVPRNVAAGNVLFKNTLISRDKLQFDTYYNFIGGEDFDFFDRATKLGNAKVWCSEGIVYETIPEERRTKKYLFYRHFTGAINNVLYYKKKNNALIAWPHFLIKSFGKLFSAFSSFIIFILTFKIDRFEKSIIKLASAIGYISGLLNIIIERYR